MNMTEYYNTPIGELTKKNIFLHEAEILMFIIAIVAIILIISLIIKSSIPYKQKTYEDVLRERERDKYTNWRL